MASKRMTLNRLGGTAVPDEYSVPNLHEVMRGTEAKSSEEIASELGDGRLGHREVSWRRAAAGAPGAEANSFDLQRSSSAGVLVGGRLGADAALGPGGPRTPASDVPSLRDRRQP